MDESLFMHDGDACPGLCASSAPHAMQHESEDMVLDAVLSFLDEHDALDALHSDTTSESPTGSPSPPSSEAGDSGGHSDGSTGVPVTKEHTEICTGAQTAKPRVKRTPVRSDKRQREEMVALREESLALQDQLDGLQRELTGMREHEQSSEPTVKKRVSQQEQSSEESRKLRAEVWQAISEAHQRRREAAEQERERLRALIKEQKLAYRRLRRYLATLAEKSNESEAVISELQHQKDVGETLEAAATHELQEDDFEELSRAIPTMFLQTSGLFIDKRLDSLTSYLHELRVQNEESAKMSIEALESRLVPFDVMTTANAVWRHHLTKAYRSSASDIERLEVTDNSARRTFAASYTGVNGELTTARGRMEVRRYIEPNRVVIIKSSIMDRIQSQSTVLPAFAVREFQWTVIGPPRVDRLRNNGDVMSQIEIFRVGIPQVPDLDGANAEFMRQAVKRGCVEAVSVQLEFERQSIENILLQKLTTSAGLRSEMVQPPRW